MRTAPIEIEGRHRPSSNVVDSARTGDDRPQGDGGLAALSQSPHQRQEALQRFADAVRAQWRALFSPVLSADDVDGMVEDVAREARLPGEKLGTGFGG